MLTRIDNSFVNGRDIRMDLTSARSSLGTNGLTLEQQLELFLDRQSNSAVEQAILNTAKRIYDHARGYLRRTTENYIDSLDNPEFKNIKMKALLVSFMNKAGNPGIRFIENLTKLAQYHVSGTHKVFLNAAKSGESVSGFYNEPIAALSLIERGFTVEKVSVTEDDSGISINGNDTRREIDIVAKKDSQVYYIDVKSSVHSLSSCWKHSKKQLEALAQIAERYNALPVILLMRLPIPTIHEQEIKGLREILIKNPTLRVWNDRAEDITSSFIA